MLLTNNVSQVGRWYGLQNLNSRINLASLCLILCTFLVEKDYTWGPNNFQDGH